MVPILDLLELPLIKHISIDQTQAMLYDGLSELIKATLVALNDVHHEFHHIVLDVSLLLLHRVHFLHAFLDLTHDKFTGVAIDQDDPLVDEEFLRLELNLDRFEHLNSLNDDTEGGLGHRCIVLLKEEQVDFEAALDLRRQLDAVGDLIGANLEEILVVEHHVRVLKAVRVHEGDPLDEAHVVVLDLRGEGRVFLAELLMEENLDVGRVHLCALLWEADCGQEVARVDLQVVVEDDQGAILLQLPDLLVKLLILDRKELLVHRVVGQQGHVVVRSLDDTWRA